MMIFRDGELNIMSVVIAVCKEDFCLMLSDTRLTAVTNNGPQIISENMPKVTRINNDVLLGVTGTFSNVAETGLFAPLENTPGIDNMDTTEATNAIVSYMRSNQWRYRYMMRNYLVGGKDKDGSWKLYGIHLDPQTLDITYGLYKDVAFSPPLGLHNIDAYHQKIKSIVESNTDPHQIAQELGNIIVDISRGNDSVNSKVIAQLIP